MHTHLHKTRQWQYFILSNLAAPRVILYLLVFLFQVAFFGYLSFYSVGVKGDVLANFDVGFFPQVSRFGELTAIHS